MILFYLDDDDVEIDLKKYLTATVYHKSYDAYNDKYIENAY
jgi:hypothetical protein